MNSTTTKQSQSPGGRSSAEGKRRSSGMFAGLSEYKREANPDAYQRRKESLDAHRPAKGFLGQMWDSATKPSGSK